MTDKTPATEAGRAVDAALVGGYGYVSTADILAIEAEAYEDGFAAGRNDGTINYKLGRADALREAAERVRALFAEPGNGYEGEDDTPPTEEDILAILTETER